MKNINAPMFTIAIVSYNAEDTIRDTLNSIIRFRGSNAELIVVDGCSTDSTTDILESYSEHIDMLICEPDNGIYDAMNKCVDIARGQWLIFIGADDKLCIDLNSLTNHTTDPDISYYGNAYFINKSSYYGGKFNKIKIFYRNICHQSIFYSKSFYKNEYYNLDYPIRADHVYNMKLILSGKAEHIDMCISHYNDAGISSINADSNFQKKRWEVYCSLAPKRYIYVVWFFKLLSKVVKFFRYERS